MDLRDLQADPAGELRMPDADRLGQIARDRTLTPDGPTNAYFGYLFGTHRPNDDVLAYYRDQLARLGWTRNSRVVNRSTTDRRVDGWCKPRVAFRLPIKDPDPRVNAPELDAAGYPYPTVFRAEVVALDPEEKCVAQ